MIGVVSVAVGQADEVPPVPCHDVGGCSFFLQSESMKRETSELLRDPPLSAVVGATTSLFVRSKGALQIPRMSKRRQGANDWIDWEHWKNFRFKHRGS